MWYALTASVSGLAASTAQLNRAASAIANTFDPGATASKPTVQQPAPTSPPTPPAAAPISGQTATDAQQQADPVSWSVAVLTAQEAYRASLTTFNAVNQTERYLVVRLG